MLLSSISKNSLLLGGFALFIAAILAGTYSQTHERIQQAQRAAQQKALYEIIPRDQHENDLLADTVTIPASALAELGLKQASQVHIARQSGQVSAIIIPAVAPDGYSGDIHLIIGVMRDGSIAGVRVVAHNETPGLGDKMDVQKGRWIFSLDNRSLTNPELAGWAVKKDGGVFDQFTGATITPRAIINAVKRALIVVKREHELFFPAQQAMPVSGALHE